MCARNSHHSSSLCACGLESPREAHINQNEFFLDASPEEMIRFLRKNRADLDLVASVDRPMAKGWEKRAPESAIHHSVIRDLFS